MTLAVERNQHIEKLEKGPPDYDPRVLTSTPPSCSVCAFNLLDLSLQNVVCTVMCIYLYVPVFVCTDPSREEGAVLELAKVEGDEIRSCHEDQ